MVESYYRMGDPQVGRFWQIDPVTDKYEYISTYAFSENKVTGDIELEGLEIAMPIPVPFSPIYRPGTAHGGGSFTLPNWAQMKQNFQNNIKRRE